MYYLKSSVNFQKILDILIKGDNLFWNVLWVRWVSFGADASSPFPQEKKENRMKTTGPPNGVYMCSNKIQSNIGAFDATGLRGNIPGIYH